MKKSNFILGSASTVRTSNPRGLQFKASQWQKFILNICCQLYWKNPKEGLAGLEWPVFFFKKQVILN